MHPKQARLIIFGCVLLAAAIACNAPGLGNLPATLDVESVVSATLTALSSADAPATDPVPTQTPLSADTTLIPIPEEANTPVPIPREVEPGTVHVAYINEGNIFFWSEGGVPNQLTFDGGAIEILLSDDTSIVAFVRSFDFLNYEIWAVNSNGSDERRLVSIDDFNAIETDEFAIGVAPNMVVWVPETHSIAFNTFPLYEGPGLALNGDLYIVNADTGELFTFLDPNNYGQFFYSPDGSEIALVNPANISLIDSNGDNLRSNVLPYEPVITCSEYRYHARPVWSPDSSFLRVVLPPMDPLADPKQRTTVWHIPVDGSRPNRIGEFFTAPFFFASLDYKPLSSDLNHFAYLEEIGDPVDNTRDLHIVDLESASDVVYTSGQFLEFQSWAPDSERFAYSVENSPPLLGQVGHAPVPLTDDPNAIIASWVDPTRIIFYSGNEPWELRLGFAGGASTIIDIISGGFRPSYDFQY